MMRVGKNFNSYGCAIHLNWGKKSMIFKLAELVLINLDFFS